MPDQMNITILEDGTIKVETDKISGANHLNAESFLREMSKLAGGQVTTRRKQAQQDQKQTKHVQQ